MEEGKWVNVNLVSTIGMVEESQIMDINKMQKAPQKKMLAVGRA